jgi:hypothetical protein
MYSIIGHPLRYIQSKTTLMVTVVAPSSFNVLRLDNCELNSVTYFINHEICYDICDSHNNEY